MNFTKQLIILLEKDLRLELHRKELLFLCLALAAVLAAVVGFTTKSAFLTQSSINSLFPGLSWLIFLFTVTIAIARSYEHDLENRAIDGLITCGVSTNAIYCAKLITNFIGGQLTYWSAFFFLILFTNATITTINLDYILLVSLVIFACSALSTLLAPIVHNSALRALLFPLLYIPLVLVLFIIAIELSSSLLLSGNFVWNSPLVALLIAACVGYTLAGINLIEYVIKR